MPLALDLDGPHATLLVGKRGYGKSYTLGVLAEELARTTGVAPVLVDPVGVFRTLREPAEGEPVPATVIEHPTVSPSSLDPPTWCDLVGLSPESGAGGLVWQAGAQESTLDDMRTNVRKSDAPIADKTLQGATEDGYLTEELLVISIDHDDGEPAMTPDGETRIRGGDVVTLFSRSGLADETLRAFTGNQKDS